MCALLCLSAIAGAVWPHTFGIQGPEELLRQRRLCPALEGESAVTKLEMLSTVVSFEPEQSPEQKAQLERLAEDTCEIETAPFPEREGAASTQDTRTLDLIFGRHTYTLTETSFRSGKALTADEIELLESGEAVILKAPANTSLATLQKKYGPALQSADLYREVSRSRA